VIDVAKAQTEKERLIAWRLAAKGAAGRIAGRIGLSLDNATAQPAHR